MFSQGLSKALLELRAEMTSAAEQQVIASAAQREESLNVQMLVDKHTKDLKVGSKCPFLLTCHGFIPVNIISSNEALLSINDALLDVLCFPVWHNG